MGHGGEVGAEEFGQFRAFLAHLYFESRFLQFFHKGGFAHGAAAHQQQFGLQEEDGFLFNLVKVIAHRGMALSSDFQRGEFQGIAC